MAPYTEFVKLMTKNQMCEPNFNFSFTLQSNHGDAEQVICKMVHITQPLGAATSLK